ncbi:Ig-like domain-containing protein [bacterium]|nr:Ig-like domain-containing protein [bacterium]
MIMDGVATIDVIYYTVSCDLESGATWIADLANGYDLAAINAAEDVVGFNLYPGDYLAWTGDGWVMINNAIRFIGDFTVPEVSGQVPANGATGVAVNSDIVFHVTDDMIGVDTSTISFSVEDSAKAASSNMVSLENTSTSSQVTIEHTSAITGTLVTDDTDPNDVICTFTPDSDLPADTIICTIAAGLADDAGNATGADIVWSFDTVGSSVEETTWGQIKAL